MPAGNSMTMGELHHAQAFKRQWRAVDGFGRHAAKTDQEPSGKAAAHAMLRRRRPLIQPSTLQAEFADTFAHDRSAPVELSPNLWRLAFPALYCYAFATWSPCRCGGDPITQTRCVRRDVARAKTPPSFSCSRNSNVADSCACGRCATATRRPSACCRQRWRHHAQHAEHPHQGLARSWFHGPRQRWLSSPLGQDLLKRLSDVQAFANRWTAARAKK